jgi:hypothetical protein
MGQSVSQQLGTDALGYGVDPEYLRSQILQQREKQLLAIQNPQQQLAARLGGLLGGGLTNLAQDRGFFEVNDPLLTKVTQIQGIYNQVAQKIDPAANPEQFFTELQKSYADAGLGQQALMAAREAQKAKTTGMDIQIKETQLFEKNPELLAGRITAALESGNEPEANRLANLNARLIEDRDLKLEKARTDILKDKAYIAYQNSLAADQKFTYKPVDPLNPLAGDWKIDKSGKREYVPFPDDVASKLSPPSKDAKKSDKERAPLNSFSTTATTSTPAAAPAAQTTWSGVLIQPKAAVPLTAMQERDFAIQRAMPNVVVSLLTEEQKNVLAQNLGL